MQERVQFGISYISSFLRKHGHRTELAVLSRLWGQRNETIIDQQIDAFNPRLICFTAVATEYGFMAQMARYIKRQYPRIYLLIGGVHVTLNPQEVLGDGFDALCVGEGEGPTLELVRQLEKTPIPSGIPNTWIKNGSNIEKNATQEFLQNLDMLPFPDRAMWQRWMDQKEPEVCSLLLSRGCPYHCSYCCNHALRKTAPGIYVRHRSPGNIIAEIKEILMEFPKMKEIFLETETVVSNVRWCLELCAGLKDFNATLSRPLSFGANFRIIPHNDLDRIFSALKGANFRFVNIGLESGSERIRCEVLRRDYSNADVIGAVNLARKHGIQIGLFNLIGIPGETLEDFKETVRINRICKPDWHYTSIFFPYPGTDLWCSCLAQGLLPKAPDPGRERKRAIFDLPGFSRKQIQESYDFFDYYIYYGLDRDDRFFGSKLAAIRIPQAVYRGLIRLSFLNYFLRPLKNFLKSKIVNRISRRSSV